MLRTAEWWSLPHVPMCQNVKAEKSIALAGPRLLNNLPLYIKAVTDFYQIKHKG